MRVMRVMRVMQMMQATQATQESTPMVQPPPSARRVQVASD
jgi:hypothetical protein